MPKTASPFAGHKLSEQTVHGAPPIDQRLFTSAPRPAAPKKPVPALQEPVAAMIPPATTLPPPTGDPQAAQPADTLDVGQLPYRKHSCLLTPEEFDALDELKVALRKKLGGTVTKENLTRCAIHYLIDDFRRHGESSAVLAPLKKLVKEW